ncbi:MAG: ATP-binding cassette domain-containing protein [Candidatus Iainarchaeum archaeon]|uniref:ATP-binding cassette domain-containing protein n=1 Tax=Candidatus Iainarchaeum sp. TaxID=3101447 RepID=A0A7T9I2I5_9ARCH|nr:MAG: ATP-binding cassette domain-containing protein [Candidatus Diapherotrites archaeon]
MPAAIVVKNLTKEFEVPAEGKTGVVATLLRKNKKIRAIDRVSLAIQEGEILGYIGPNGGGKSTTIKLLTGILTPTQGEATVIGFTPWKERSEYTRHIGVVFGQKSLLNWDVAPVESFRLYKEIYEMDEATYAARIHYLAKLFTIEQFMHTPTRKLSLGQRMRCELVAALLHKPRVLFLDEPTIGLDAIAKQKMREAIREVNRKEKTTIILTTHDMNDIEELASRIMILDKGKIIYEGDLDKMKNEFAQEHKIVFEPNRVKDEKKFAQFIEKYDAEQSGRFYTLVFNSKTIKPKRVLDELFDLCDLEGFEVFAPTLEEVIREIYAHQPA